ncbi:MAG: hypothetical protein FNP40_08570 [Dehalobacter sp. 4CP]|nr:hypothetical protein [Dehalobacter sp. 4CP]
MIMDAQEYGYRMKPLVIPGVLYIILYPLLIGGILFFYALPTLYLLILSGIYAVTILLILLIWLTAKTKRIVIDDQAIIFRSLFRKKTFEPKDIRKASFFWTKNNEEIVLLKAGNNKVYYLTDLYFPYNELLTDLEEFIISHNIRSNLAAHYGIN